MAAWVGAFNFPRHENRLNINVYDEVLIDWWSTGADQLIISCAEGVDLDSIWTTTYSIDNNGTQVYSPISLSREFDDWSLVAICNLTIRTTVDDSEVGPEELGVTSVEGQPSSRFERYTTYAIGSSSIVPSTTTPSILETMTSSTTASSTAVPSTSVGSLSSPTATPTSSPTQAPDPGLSTGAKAGIGVGAAFGALLIATTAYIFYRNRRKMKLLENRASAQSGYQCSSNVAPPGVGVAESKPQMSYHDAEAWGQQEMVSPHQDPSELATSGR